MSSVGLVLGGGGITGAAFHFGALLSLRMATDWNPAEADVVVGTSSGAVVAALVRSERLSLDALIGDVPRLEWRHRETESLPAHWRWRWGPLGRERLEVVHRLAGAAGSPALNGAAAG